MNKEVILVKHNTGWKKIYADEIKILIPLFTDNFISIHHIGSTSVPAIYAKPIIDMLALVKNINKVDEVNESFINAGYFPKGEYGISGRRYFIKGKDHKNRTHHLHVFENSNKENVLRHIAFRDYLINFPETANDYSELKISLLKKFRYDGNSYQDGKDEFIKEIQSKALEWFKDRKKLF